MERSSDRFGSFSDLLPPSLGFLLLFVLYLSLSPYLSASLHTVEAGDEREIEGTSNGKDIYSEWWPTSSSPHVEGKGKRKRKAKSVLLLPCTSLTWKTQGEGRTQ